MWGEASDGIALRTGTDSMGQMISVSGKKTRVVKATVTNVG